jgi:hypothetical protein
VSKYKELLDAFQEREKTYLKHIQEIERISDELLTRFGAYLGDSEKVTLIPIKTRESKIRDIICTKHLKAYIDDADKGFWTIPLSIRMGSYSLDRDFLVQLGDKEFTIKNLGCEKQVTTGAFEQLDDFIECVFNDLISTYRDAVKRFQDDHDIRHLKIYSR